MSIEFECEKNKNKPKEAGIGPFLKKTKVKNRTIITISIPPILVKTGQLLLLNVGSKWDNFYRLTAILDLTNRPSPASEDFESANFRFRRRPTEAGIFQLACHVPATNYGRVQRSRQKVVCSNPGA